MRASCSVHLNVLYLIYIMVLGFEYKLLSSELTHFYDLCNDAASSLDSIWTVEWQYDYWIMNWKGCGRKRSCPVENKEITENLTQSVGLYPVSGLRF
jgi:hypothetical protein